MPDLCCIADEFWGCGRRVCGFIICFLCFGPVCIIIAIAMFVMAGKDPRGHHISTYNNAVDMWEGANYGLFSDLNLSIGVTDQAYGVIMNATAQYSPDPIDDDGSTIRRYTDYLRYEYRGEVYDTVGTDTKNSVKVTNLRTGESTNVGVTVVKEYSYSQSSLNCKCSSSTRSTTSSSSSSNCYDDYRCRQNCYNQYNGDYYNRYCYAVKYVTTVCAKIQEDGSFTSNDNFAYAQYSDYQPDDYHGYNSNRNIPSNFKDVTVVVRSADDPFIVLYDLTNGSLDFGLSAKEYALIGIVFIVVGGFCIALVVGVFALAIFLGHCLCFKSGRSRF